MTRRLAVILAVTTAFLMIPAAASSLPATSLASVVADPPSITWPDRSVVLQPVPGKPCAAPVFGAPQDGVHGPVLAETGIDRALQLTGLLALALAGLMGPGRSRRAERPGAATPG
jgi:hypothetical protein